MAVGVPTPRRLAELKQPTPSYQGSGASGGFSPADLRAAYNLPGEGGEGMTVAITIAYDDPKAEEDLASYRSYYGLPACTTANGCFKKVNQKGEEGNYPEPNSTWAIETSLDLDMVSAACPKCHIILVEANSNVGTDLYVAVETAVKLGANVVSNSWAGEEYPSETGDDHYFNHPGVPMIFASGDWGYRVEYPAASPYVVSVGGTSLRKAENARGWSESAWSEAGSGCSEYEGKPGWQKDAGCAKRTVADVSAVADPETPVSIYDTYILPGWLLSGGTSVATPLIAGVEALSSSAVRSAGPSAFRYAAFGGELFDSVKGENSAFCGTYLCHAEAGYDGPTGWGSPNGPLSLPVAATEGVSVASGSKATFRGLIRPGGLETKYHFEYGETTSYGSSVPIPDQSAGSGSEYVEVSQTASNLKGRRTYHYRITATNSEGTFHGVDRTFGTTPPVATVSAAGEVHANDVVLHGAVNPEGSTTSYYFEYGTGTSYGRKAPLDFQEVGSGTSSVEVSAPIDALSGGSTYHFRIAAKNSAGTTYSKDATFTTAQSQWTAQLLSKQHINPNPGEKPYDTDLSGVSCVTPEDCMAVGDYRSFRELMDSQHWDGKEWTSAPMAEPNEATESIVTDVSCSSGSWCVAVGLYSAKPLAEQEGLPLVETWNGSKWSAVSVPLPKGAQHVSINSIPLWGVSCSSQVSCMAVGEYRTEGGEAPHLRPLVYRWDGKEWSLLSMPAPPNSNLSFFAEDVSCVSSTWCMVIGGHNTEERQWYNQMAEVWNGSEWEIVKAEAPNPSNEATTLSNVSCTTVSSCAALTWDTGLFANGKEGVPPAEHWDGQKWMRGSLPASAGGDYAEPLGISCSAVDVCTAVGYARVHGGYAPVAFGWDGSKWSIQSTSEPLQGEEGQLPASRSLLEDVSCPSPSNCIAVGSGLLQGGEMRGMAEFYRAPGPRSRTLAATNVTGAGATIKATVNPEGKATSYYFEYGTTASYGTKIPVSPTSIGAGTSDVAVSQAPTGLAQASTYHYRVVAENEDGRTLGEDKAFTTLKFPKATTEAASAINATQTTLNATVNPEGNATSYYFEYGTTASYGTKIPVSPTSIGAGTSDMAVSQTPTGLTQATTYHFRVVAESSAGTVYGKDLSFATKKLKVPVASTEAASAVTSSRGTLNGSVNPEGNATSYYFEYGPTTAYGNKTANESAGSGTSAVKESAALNLPANATYHFRIVATNGESTVQGEDAQFTTSSVTFSTSFGSSGTGNGQLKNPKGIAVDSSGNLWVVDSGNNRVQKFNSKGEYLSQFGSLGAGNGQFSVPRGIAIDSSGNLWVVDTGNNRVQKFNSKGEYLSQFGSLGAGNGQFKTPIGIAIDSSGNLWVVDSNHHLVKKFNASGEYQSQIGTGSAGSANGQFSAPNGIAVDSSGNLWVTDTNNNRLQKFNSKGEYLSQFGTNGGGNGQLWAPRGIAIDSSDNLWVVDGSNNRVQKFNSKGEYLSQFGTQGTGSGQFEAPDSIAIDSTGNPWVTDGSNHRVQRWLKAPRAVTEAANSVSGTAAVANATINPEGNATTYYWEYGTTTAYGSQTAETSAGSGTGDLKRLEWMKSLASETTYHFRVVAKSAGGTVYGQDETFTTLIHPPVNTVLPTISPEEAKVGTVETVTSNGTWSYSPTYSYQWLRCDYNGEECLSISEATKSTYTPVSADVGYRLVARVTASNAGGWAQATSKAAKVISGGVQSWYACTKGVGAFPFSDSICSKPDVEGGYGWGKLASSTGFVMSGLTSYVLTLPIVTEVAITCTSQSAGGTIENHAGAAGTLGEPKFSLSGCSTTKPSGSGCSVPSTLPLNALKGEAVEAEGKPALKLSPVSGEALMTFTISGCSNGAFNGVKTVNGSFTALANKTNSKLEFTATTSNVTLGGQKGSLVGSSKMETSGERVLELAP